MLHQSAIEGYFAQQEGLLVEAVSRLVRIDSTLGPAQPGQPFGPGPAAALEAFLSLAQEWGLPGENLSGYVGTVSPEQPAGHRPAHPGPPGHCRRRGGVDGYRPLPAQGGRRPALRPGHRRRQRPHGGRPAGHEGRPGP